MKHQMLLKYLADYQSAVDDTMEFSKNTKRSYQSDLRQFNDFLITAEDEILNINSANLLYAYLRKLGTVQNLKPATIKRKFIVIHKFYNYMERNNMIPNNPFQNFTLKMPRERILPRVLQKQELFCLLSAVKAELPFLSPYHVMISLRNLAILDLLICTGTRIGELSALRLQDYNQSSNTLLIKGKGQKERLVYISSPDVADEISQWLSIRPGLNPKCDSFFVNKYGNPLSIYGIENIFYKYRELSGINTNSTPHYLRHTFASDDTFAS